MEGQHRRAGLPGRPPGLSEGPEVTPLHAPAQCDEHSCSQTLLSHDTQARSTESLDAADFSAHPGAT